MPDLRDFARSLESLANGALEKAIKQAELKTATEAKRVAEIQFSSGQNDRNALARAGHPYSRRAPNPSYNPAVINGTRAFLHDWQEPQQTTDGDGGLLTFVRNTDPNTRWLFGTKNMVERDGMLVEIEALMQPTRLANLDHSIRAVLSATFR